MKYFFLISFIFFSSNIVAHEIEGTLMLKGALKTKVTVSGLETVCKLKVEKVTNLLEEDSFGNPAYQARVQLSLNGNDIDSGRRIKFGKEYIVTNLHSKGKSSIVKDFDYFSSEDNLEIKIDDSGRLISSSFIFKQQKINCGF